MAMTGYYKTLVRPRQHRPLSMLKYDPVGKSRHFLYVLSFDLVGWDLDWSWGFGADGFVGGSEEEGVVFGAEAWGEGMRGNIWAEEALHGTDIIPPSESADGHTNRV